MVPADSSGLLLGLDLDDDIDVVADRPQKGPDTKVGASANLNDQCGAQGLRGARSGSVAVLWNFEFRLIQINRLKGRVSLGRSTSRNAKFY
jgi:hypothetical protein